MSNEIKNVEYRNLRLDSAGSYIVFNDVFRSMLKMCNSFKNFSKDIILENINANTKKVIKLTTLALFHEIVEDYFINKQFKEYVSKYSDNNFNLIVDYYSDESAWNKKNLELKSCDKSFPNCYNNTYVLNEKQTKEYIVKISIICIGCLDNNWEMHLLIKIGE